MVSFEGLGEVIATFYNSSLVNNCAGKGEPVKMCASREVSKVPSGERFIGVASSADGDYVGVLLSGYAELPYTGTAPAAGYARLVANGAGGVKADTATSPVGGEYLIVKVDTTASVVGFII